MAEYYLISQLPSLDGLGEGAPLPITEERFLELCKRFLKEKTFSKLENITLSPPRYYEGVESGLIDAWNQNERNLRLALMKSRSEKLNKPFSLENNVLSAEYVKLASEVVEMDNPMEAEKKLNRCRLDFLETLRPFDTFAEDYVYYYCLKLKLILRIKQFDMALGEEAYRNIYNSILSGDRLEDIQ